MNNIESPVLTDKQSSAYLGINNGETDEKVAESLYKSAIGGHFIQEEKLAPSGEIISLRRQLPPNTTAQIFWITRIHFRDIYKTLFHMFGKVFLRGVIKSMWDFLGIFLRNYSA